MSASALAAVQEARLAGMFVVPDATDSGFTVYTPPLHTRTPTAQVGEGESRFGTDAT